ncbi:MAG: hypothetical protein EXX96DRAFT_604226 [Benjaminiella poitrasii]|nr:MAG: hypothetical protein EXX96DRAFT_604226 [Benjaminiella poitrasii]
MSIHGPGRSGAPCQQPLDTEALQLLQAYFYENCSTTPCPFCSKQGVICRHGISQSTPAHRLFGSFLDNEEISSTSQIMNIEPLSADPNSLLQVVAKLKTESSHMQQKMTAYDCLVEQLTHLHEELTQTKKELQTTKTGLAKLQEENNRLKAQHSTASTQSIQPWHQPISQWNTAPSRGKLIQATAIRTFQPPSETQGFQHVFLPTKARMPVGQIRSRLQKLNIHNGRVLDIHYPTRNVVALLVHNDFAVELKERFAKFQMTTLDDFDPCDPQHLQDPKYVDYPPTERSNMAFDHHCERMQKALESIRYPICHAVARYFYAQK